MGQTPSSSKKVNLAFSHFFNAHQFFFAVFEKLNKICVLSRRKKSLKIKVFALFLITKKDLAVCITTDLQGQFLCLNIYSVGREICPLSGYFSFPCNTYLGVLLSDCCLCCCKTSDRYTER